jgi:hypothetical protein
MHSSQPSRSFVGEIPRPLTRKIEPLGIAKQNEIGKLVESQVSKIVAGAQAHQRDF